MSPNGYNEVRAACGPYLSIVELDGSSTRRQLMNRSAILKKVLDIEHQQNYITACNVVVQHLFAAIRA